MNDQAVLVLEDGSVFRGQSIGFSGVSVGEVVFNTSMTGYQEILTDPSYASQIVTLTYPHIGNVGTNAEDEESPRIFCAGLVIRDLPRRTSNWRTQQSLSDYLREREVVAIADIDTRRLTRLLRSKGALRGCIAAGDAIDESAALEQAKAFPGLAGMDLAREVTTDSAYRWNEAEKPSVWDLEQGYLPPSDTRFHVVACDYGVKRNILRLLTERGCEVTVVPATSSAEDIMALNPDGVFLSNGPGDPEPCDYAITAISEVIARDVPVFGICLGHQLLALASGARTEKMKFGHHGANHPVQDLDSKRVLITSQNHGFMVDENTLPDNLRVTHRSLFDGSIQGVERVDKPAYSFQGHPEASPGPKDINGLFDRFISMMSAGGAA